MGGYTTEYLKLVMYVVHNALSQTFLSWFPHSCIIIPVLPNVHQEPAIEHTHIHKPLVGQLQGRIDWEFQRSTLYDAIYLNHIIIR